MAVFLDIINGITSAIKTDSSVAFAVLGIALAWLIFRLGNYQQRKSLLVSLKEELNIIGKWIGNPYDDTSNNKHWYSPLFMVFGFQRFTAVTNIVSNANISLLSKELIRKLVNLNLGINRFQYHIDRYFSYITSSPKSIDAYFSIKKDLEDNKVDWCALKQKVDSSKISGKPFSKVIGSYLEFVYGLNKYIHTDGIGKLGHYEDGMPTPYSAFHSAKKALDEEIGCCFWTRVFNTKVPHWYVWLPLNILFLYLAIVSILSFL